MVDFEDMSYETLQKAVERKFDVELPDKREETVLEKVKRYIAKNPFILHSEHKIINVEEESYNQVVVYVPLPNCNDTWTFQAWEWTKAFCKECNACPYHDKQTKYAPHNYIKIILRNT